MRRYPTAVHPCLEVLENRIAPTTGVFLREEWTGISGVTVVDLTSNPAFAGSPSSSAYLTSLQTPTGAGPANYGERLRGTVTAPQTGAYTFYVEGDAETQLFLSDAADPANRRLLADVPIGGTTAAGQWNKYPQQKSAPVRLVAGQRYYLEVLHKHGSAGADHTAVGWQLPDGTFERPIPATRLDPVLPTVQLWATDPSANRYGHTATFTVSRDDDLGRDLTVTYAISGSAVNGTDYTTLPTSVVIPRGQHSADIILSPLARTSGAKQATLTLQAGAGYQLALPSTLTATATIAVGVASLGTATAASPADWINTGTWGLGGGATQSTLSLNNPPFTQAKHVVVSQVTPNFWDVGTSVRNSVPIANGDNLVLTVWLRQADTNRPQAIAQLGMQQAGGNYTSVYFTTVTVGPQWQRFDFTFPSNQTFAVNGGQVYLDFGSQVGTTDIGGLTLTDTSATGGSTLVTPADWLSAAAWGLGGGATQNTISLGGPTFTQAKRFVVPQVTPNPWDVDALVHNSAPIAAGDNLVLTVWLRQADTTRPQADVSLGFQQVGGNYTVVYSNGVAAGPQWQRFDFSFTCTQAFAANGAWFYLSFGAEVGTTDIGGLTVTDYGASGGNTSVSPANWLNGLYAGTGTYGTQSTVAVPPSYTDPLPFTQAKRFQVTTVPPAFYQVQAAMATTAPINSGDHLLLTAWIRSADPAHPIAVVDLVVQQSGGAYTVFGQDRFSATASWTRIDLPLTANQDYAVGGAQVTITFGTQLQTVDVGGVILTDTTTGFSPLLLPQTDNTYVGRDPTAYWRADADARIDQARKANLTVIVRDQNGMPIDGAVVHANLTNLAFDYGSAVSASLLVNNTTADAVTYRSKVLQLYNTVTLENDLKWSEWQANRQRALDAANWIVSNGLLLRGHNLVWPSWSLTPSSTGASSGTYNGVAWSASAAMPASQAEYNAHVTADGLDAAKAWLANRILAHITDEVGALAGKPYVWDVVNEPYNNHDLMDLLGQTSMLDWYSAAHTANPNVLLALNDWGLLGPATAHQDTTYNWAKYLQDNATLGGRNARLDVIGFQSYFGASGLPSFDTIAQAFDRFGTLGLRMEVTEFAITTSDEQLQADYTRDYMKYIFSYPAMTAFVRWDFWEGSNFAPASAMIRSDWTLKPNAQVWIDATQQLWHTDATGTSWQGGQFVVRGYDGTYSVTVTYNGQTVTVPVTLAAGGNSVVVTLTLPQPPPGGFQDNNESGQTLDGNGLLLTLQSGGTAVARSWTPALGNGGTGATTSFPGALGDGNVMLRTGGSLGAERTDAFFSLHEDSNGDHPGDGLDLSLLRSTFDRTSDQPGDLAFVDRNGDGAMNELDFFPFRARCNTSLSP